MASKSLTQRVPLLSALRSTSFTYLWGGQVFSRLGNSTYNIALVWFVLQLTGSATATGFLLVVGMLPNLIFSLLGGVVADRASRRAVLIWSDTLRAIAMFLLAFLGWRNMLSYWHLVFLTLCFGIIGSFFLPAYQAVIPQIIPKEKRPSANALNSLGTNISQIAGPLLGSLCFTLVGAVGVFIFNGITFIVSALCIVLAHLPQDVTSSSPHLAGITEPSSPIRQGYLYQTIQRVGRDIREGMSLVKNVSWLWITLIISAIANLGFGAPFVVLPKLVAQSYNMGIWLLGAINVAGACAAILVILWLGHFGVHRYRAFKAYGALIFSSLGLLAFGLPFPHAVEPLIACVASFMYSFGIGAFTFIWLLLLQDCIPDDKRGRVFSIDLLASTCMVPLGYALSGYLADRIGPAHLFIGAGIFTLFVVSCGLLVPDIRKEQVD